MEPIISVIVPIYKVESYLEQCVRSIRNQTLRDIEIILIDDGSPDNCPQLCDQYAGEDERIRVVHQKNAGVSAARNAGIELARGVYITFVDSDDWVKPDYLSAMLECMTPGGLAACEFVCEWEPIRRLPRRAGRSDGFEIAVLSREETQASVLCGGRIDGHLFCKLFDRKLIEELRIAFCEDLSYAEDGLFVMQYLSGLTAQAMLVKMALYHYRYQGQSLTRQRIRRYPKYDPQIFAENIAVERTSLYFEHTPELLRCYTVRKVEAQKSALAVMAVNKWTDLPNYKPYLREIRANLFQYLRYGKSPLSIKACTVLCAVHPRLYDFCLKAWFFFLEHQR